MWSGISEAGLRWENTGRKSASRRDAAMCRRFGHSPSRIEKLKLETRNPKPETYSESKLPMFETKPSSASVRILPATDSVDSAAWGLGWVGAVAVCSAYAEGVMHHSPGSLYSAHPGLPGSQDGHTAKGYHTTACATLAR